MLASAGLARKQFPDGDYRSDVGDVGLDFPYQPRPHNLASFKHSLLPELSRMPLERLSPSHLPALIRRRIGPYYEPQETIFSPVTVRMSFLNTEGTELGEKQASLCICRTDKLLSPLRIPRRARCPRTQRHRVEPSKGAQGQEAVKYDSTTHASEGADPTMCRSAEAARSSGTH